MNTFRFNRANSRGQAHIDIERDVVSEPGTNWQSLSGLATGRIVLFEDMSGKQIETHTRTFPDDVSNESICISLTKILYGE